MKPLTKATPITIIGILVGGIVLSIGGLFLGMLSVSVGGVLVVACGLLYGAFGCFHSVVALSSAKRRRASGVASPVATMLVTIAAWTAVIEAVSHVYRGIRFREQRQACLSNLHEIGRIMYTYARVDDGNYPDTFRGVISPDSGRRFLCPSIRRAKPGDDGDVDEWSSYVLVHARSVNDLPDTVLAYCSEPKALRRYREYCVLYVDGRVSLLPEEEYRALMAMQPGSISGTPQAPAGDSRRAAPEE